MTNWLQWIAIVAPWAIWGVVKMFNFDDSPKEIAERAEKKAKDAKDEIKALAEAAGFTWVYDKINPSFWGFCYGTGGKWVKTSTMPKRRKS